MSTEETLSCKVAAHMQTMGRQRRNGGKAFDWAPWFFDWRRRWWRVFDGCLKVRPITGHTYLSVSVLLLLLLPLPLPSNDLSSCMQELRRREDTNISPFLVNRWFASFTHCLLYVIDSVVRRRIHPSIEASQQHLAALTKRSHPLWTSRLWLWISIT